MVFDFFDHPHDIELISMSRGYRDQTTGDWVTPAVTATTIKGNFVPKPLVEERGGRVEQVVEGDALLYTASDLQEGYRVKIHHDASGSNFTIFRVEGTTRVYGTFERYLPVGTARKCYCLIREDDS